MNVKRDTWKISNNKGGLCDKMLGTDIPNIPMMDCSKVVGNVPLLLKFDGK